MIEELLKILTTLGWSATKYFFGISSALLFEYSFLMAMLLTVGGGMTGVVIFLYFGEKVFKTYRRFFPVKSKGIKINKFRRMLVKTLNRFGLTGIAFLTPILLTVPIGSIIAMSFEHNKWKIKKFMFVSFCLWSFAVLGSFHFFEITPENLLGIFVR